MSNETAVDFKSASFMEKLKSTGPAWMAAGLNIGGATVTNSVLLAAATGFQFGWVFIFATFAIFITTYVCVKLTMVTNKNPIELIKSEIHPVFGWLVGLAILIVNTVFHTVQITLVGSVLNTIIPVSPTFWAIVSIGLAGAIVLIPSKSANTIIQKALKYMIYTLSISYIITLFFIDVEWGSFFKGMFSFALPTSKQSVLLFTAVLGSALAINVPTVQAFATKTKEWGSNRLPYFRFETILTNVFLLFVQLVVLLVVASTLFKEGINPKNAIEAALSLGPLAGKYSTILFCVGMFGALLSTMAAQTSVAAYTFLDLIGKKTEPGTKNFKIVQAVMLIFALSVPLFGWNPFSVVAWGAAFNSSFMPIGIAAWAILINKEKLVGEHKAKPLFNVALIMTFCIALAAAIRFWFVTLS